MKPPPPPHTHPRSKPAGNPTGAPRRTRHERRRRQTEGTPSGMGFRDPPRMLHSLPPEREKRPTLKMDHVPRLGILIWVFSCDRNDGMRVFGLERTNELTNTLKRRDLGEQNKNGSPEIAHNTPQSKKVPVRESFTSHLSMSTSVRVRRQLPTTAPRYLTCTR